MIERVVLWSDNAKISYDSNIEFLQEEWTYNEIKNFINKTDEAIERLRMFPYIGQPIQDFENYRRIIIVPQISLVYRVVNVREILLITFFNNYQDPYKLQILLS